MAVYSERQQTIARIRCLDSLISAFQTMARELQATAPPMAQLLHRLPPGPAKAWLTGKADVIADLSEPMRQALSQTKAVLGAYDGQTQARALLRTADQLQQERDILAQAAPTDLRTRQALVLSGAAVLTILLL